MRATPFAPPSAPRQVWRQSPLARVLVLEKFRVCAFEHGRVTAETLGFLRTIQNPLTSFMKSKSEMQRMPYDVATLGILTVRVGCTLTFPTGFSKVMMVELNCFADAVNHGSAISGDIHDRCVFCEKSFSLAVRYRMMLPYTLMMDESDCG